MVDTTALVGTAKVGTARVGSLGATPPPRLRVHGACWELVADQAAIDAAKDHVAEREQVVRDDLALLAQEKADAAKDAAVQAAGEAAQRADEALEAALGEMVEGKSNVFIQDVPPVASMQRQGVLWIDTMPVTLADGTTVSGHTPKTWDPATSAWVAVTDSVAVEAARAAAAAHEAAEAAADAAGAAMAEARYAPRIDDRMPTPTDGEGKPAGAGWWQYDPASQLLVQGWRWTGAVWERLDMDPVMIPVINIGTGTVGDLTGDRVTVTGEFVARVAQILQLDVAQLVVTEDAVINDLVAKAMAAATAEFQTAYIQNLRSNGAAIDQAVIGEIAANLITSGLFRTAAEGQRLEIDSNGLIMWGVDPEGIEYEMVRLGPAGENLLTIGETTIAPTGVASPRVDAGELTIGGVPLPDVLSPLPRSVEVWGQVTESSAYDSSNKPRRRAEIQCYLEPGRLYEVSLSAHYLEQGFTAPTAVTEYLHYSFDGVPIFPESPGAGVVQGMSAIHYLPHGRAYTVPGTSFVVDTSGWSGRRTFWCMYSLASMSSAAPVRLVAGPTLPLTMAVEDLGAARPGIVKRWNDNNSGGGQDAGTTVQRFTKEYVSTGYRTYNADGSEARTASGPVPDVVHGSYAGAPSNHNRRGGWTFSSMTGDLAGATIEKVEVFASCTHTYSSAGSTVNIATWGGNMATGLATVTSIYGWRAGTGKWITLPASTHAGFRSGTIAGFGVRPTSTSTAQYARLAPTGARIRITARK